MSAPIVRNQSTASCRSTLANYARVVPAVGLSSMFCISAFSVTALASPLLTLEGDSVVSMVAMQDPSTPPPAPEKEWKSHFTLAAGGTAGNTETANLAIIVTSQRSSERDSTKVDGAVFYDSNRGDKTTWKFTAGVLQDWFVADSPWLYFATGRYDYDEFQSWWHRLAGHGGVGYKLYNEEKFKLTLRGGLGASKEWGSVDEDLKPEGLLGFNLAWKINDKQSLTLDSTYYPNLEELSEFRTLTVFDWNIMLDEEAAMSLAVGIRHEYQSETDAGIKPNDFRFLVGLQFDF